MDKKKNKEIQLVKMVDKSGKEADVHPDEVHNFALSGYVEMKSVKNKD
jgi:hypothetical protein